MKIYRTTQGIVIESAGQFFLSSNTIWDDYINRDDLFAAVAAEIEALHADGSLPASIGNQVLAPIVGQEVWASGVTYLRSREARMEESKDSGGGDFYAKVYDAERPELCMANFASRSGVSESGSTVSETKRTSS